MLDSSIETARSARALHRVLIKARHLALENSDERLAGILDWAELLAADMALPENRSREFTEHLEAHGADHPDFAGVYQDYQENRI